MTFPSVVVIASATPPPAGGLHYLSAPDVTTVRILAPTLTPRKDGKLSLSLYVNTRGEGAVFDPVAERPGAYIARVYAPRMHPWLDMLMEGGNGPESGSIPEDGDEHHVRLYHY